MRSRIGTIAVMVGALLLLPISVAVAANAPTPPPLDAIRPISQPSAKPGGPRVPSPPPPDAQNQPRPGQINPADPKTLPPGTQMQIGPDGVLAAAAPWPYPSGCGAPGSIDKVSYQVCDYADRITPPEIYYRLYVYNNNSWSVALRWQTGTFRDGIWYPGPLKGPSVVPHNSQAILESGRVSCSGAHWAQVVATIKTNRWAPWVYGRSQDCSLV